MACMANTSPTVDTPEQIQYIREKASQACGIHVYPIGAVSVGLQGGELTDADALKKAGAIALSDDGCNVDNANLMRDALIHAKRLELPVLCHCEDTSMVANRAVNELARFAPREVLLSPGAADPALVDYGKNKLGCRIEQAGEEAFALDRAWERVRRQFTQGLDQVPQGAEPAIQAAGALLDYLYATQKTDLSYLHTLRYYATGQFLELDPMARRNLELAETIRGKEKKGSLLWVLDKTKTAMGGRLLRSWMDRPLIDPVAISRRLEAVGYLK